MRPETVLVVDSVRVRQDSSVVPGLTEETDTATHCMAALSVKYRVPFCVVVSAAPEDKHTILYAAKRN